MSLDGTWQFAVDSTNSGLREEWFNPTFDRSGWRTVELPSSWDRYNLSAYDGVGWFARFFTVTDTSKESAIFFGGVDDDAEVWINGHHAGTHVGYSESFFFDISRWIRQGENLVVVQVRDHSGPGGIYKPVQIVPLADVGELLRSPFSKKDARPSADWVKDAIIYEVYLRSFSSEGTFKALEGRIPELKKLGVTVLWLMPIHPVGEANRKGRLGSPYSIRDYYEVNPEFGTLDDFRSLVDAVHRHGLRIIIDLVANHTAWDSKLMFEHSDWFTTDDEGAVVAPNPDWSDVADLNYDHHELRKYMISMMKYWVEDIGIDGFRCDVAELVPTDFWEVARRELDKVKPVMMLSEGTWPEHHVEAFDITYAWSTYDVLSRLLDGTTPAGIIEQILTNESYQFPQNSLRLRFNTNHDKNAWDAPAVRKFGREGGRASAVLMMTLPGIPLIYNGEEVGNEKALSLFEKVDIDWTKNQDMRRWYEDLCALRTNHDALRRGSYRNIPQPESAVVSFLREMGQDQVLSVINFSKSAKTVSVALPKGSPSAWQEYFSKKKAQSQNDSLKVSLGPTGYAVFIAGK